MSGMRKPRTQVGGRAAPLDFYTQPGPCTGGPQQERLSRKMTSLVTMEMEWEHGK